jgi:hypothetical protein
MHIRRVLALCLPERLHGVPLGLPKRLYGIPLGVALLISLIALPAEAQRNNDRNKPQQQSNRPPQEQQDIDALVRFVDAHQLADPALPKPAMPPPAPNATATATLPTPEAPAFQMSWDSNHFIRGPGGVTYIPYTLKLDRTAFPAKGVAYYVRLVDQAQAQAFASWYASAATAAAAPDQNEKTRAAANAPRPTFGWNDVQFFDLPDGNTMQRALQVAPGKYVAYFVMKEKSAAPAGNNRNNRDRNNNKDAAAAPPAKIGMLRHEIEVPDFTKPELTTSSLLLASSIEPLKEPLKPGEQEANPYVFGPMRIMPSVDAKFSQAGTINLLFWIYGAQNSPTGKPDVTVDYMFHQKQNGNEKYFNRTPQQAINATTLPPEFTAEAGLVGDLGAVPAKVFPPADYRLEVKVTDKVSGKTVTHNVNFTVVP